MQYWHRHILISQLFWLIIDFPHTHTTISAYAFFSLDEADTSGEGKGSFFFPYCFFVLRTPDTISSETGHGQLIPFRLHCSCRKQKDPVAITESV
jgi:hypothetical protein